MPKMPSNGIPTTYDEARPMSKVALWDAIASLQRDINRQRAAYEERIARGDKNFAIVCNERDVAIARPTIVNAKVEAERDTYKKMYDELLNKIVDGVR